MNKLAILGGSPIIDYTFKKYNTSEHVNETKKT